MGLVSAQFRRLNRSRSSLLVVGQSLKLLTPTVCMSTMYNLGSSRIEQLTKWRLQDVY